MSFNRQHLPNTRTVQARLQFAIMAQLVVWEARWFEVGDGGALVLRRRAFMGSAVAAEGAARDFLRYDLLVDEDVISPSVHQRELDTPQRARLAGGGCRCC